MTGTNACAIGVYTVGRKRLTFSRLCGGRAPAGSVRMSAALPDGGACGVAAVCRRPGKDPPRQFGGEGLSRLSLDANLVMGLGWSSVGLYVDIRGCVYLSAYGATGSKQSAASPAVSSLLLPASLGSGAAIALHLRSVQSSSTVEL